MERYQATQSDDQQKAEVYPNTKKAAINTARRIFFEVLWLLMRPAYA